MSVVGYALTLTQAVVAKRHAFWTALDEVVEQVPERGQLFVLMDVNARTGRRGREGLGSEKCKVFGACGRDMLKRYWRATLFLFC